MRKKRRYTKDGTPILDEHPLSLKRLWFAWCYWCYILYLHGGCRYPLWQILWYYRRPYAAFLRGYDGI